MSDKYSLLNKRQIELERISKSAQNESSEQKERDSQEYQSNLTSLRKLKRQIQKVSIIYTSPRILYKIHLLYHYLKYFYPIGKTHCSVFYCHPDSLCNSNIENILLGKLILCLI